MLVEGWRAGMAPGRAGLDVKGGGKLRDCGIILKADCEEAGEVMS